MISVALKFIPAVIVGLALSLGTLLVSTSDRFENISSCEICLNFTSAELNTSGFPFSYMQDEFEQNNEGKRIPYADDVETNIDVTSFVANWAVWSVVAFVMLLILKKLRNIVGTVVLVAVTAGMLLLYLGVIVIV